VSEVRRERFALTGPRDINRLVNTCHVIEDAPLTRPESGYQSRNPAICFRNLLLNHAAWHSARRHMTHFPQPHPSRRAARVQLGDVVLAAIRLEDGRHAKAKLQSISITGGLLQLPKALVQGDFVEVAFQTQSGPVHGMAEILTPTRNTVEGVLQPFRFVALDDDDHRRLRTSLDNVSDRHLLGLKSSVFNAPRTI